nr:Uncharacterised protein [Klebsiella pneumoniae]
MHLLLTESSAHPGMLATAEAEREYWLSLQKAAVKALRNRRSHIP